MSDENTMPEQTGESTEASATMPPTAPVGAEKVGPQTTDPAAAGSTNESPVASVANAAADAAKKASARVREAAENVDLDQFSEQAKRVSDDVTARVKEEYKKRPGVVIGVAIGAIAVVAAVARAIGRRR